MSQVVWGPQRVGTRLKFRAAHQIDLFPEHPGGLQARIVSQTQPNSNVDPVPVEIPVVERCIQPDINIRVLIGESPAVGAAAIWRQRSVHC